jgi:hypothetical protein
MRRPLFKDVFFEVLFVVLRKKYTMLEASGKKRGAFEEWSTTAFGP